MIDVRRGDGAVNPAVLVVALRAAREGLAAVETGMLDDEQLIAELQAYIAEVEHKGAAGVVHVLSRPTRRPAAVVVVGVGDGDEAGWRAAGAGLVRAASTRWGAIHVDAPPDITPAALRGLAEGAALASYRFRLAADKNGSAPKLRRATIGSTLAEDVIDGALAEAAAITDAVALARDLTNAPSAQKSPQWFADRVAAAAALRPGIRLKVFERADLEQGGFGGILAVGSGSPRPPMLVELAWRPHARRGGPRPAHVVIAGKGITFDTGGISIKSLDGMSLMRKDMAGAAVACATVMAAADLGLPVRVTALAPLAENLISGGAYRPGDVVRHFGGITTEVHNTDAEGRVVLGDALSYAVRRLSPDVVIDLATLTGAARVALGKKTAAVFGHNDELVSAVIEAGRAVGEVMWRLPLADDYAGAVTGELADLTNSPAGGAGAITAALFLREFVGSARDRWAHIDMSAPSWSDSADGLLGKGATGWGVRSMVRWLSSY